MGKLSIFMASEVHTGSDATNARKGVPGFSKRINYLFDKAGAPTDTRLTWGHKRWNVVPNTIKNWTKLNIPPQSFATLELVVSDLLAVIATSVDKTKVLSWLYAGGTNPFDPLVEQISQSYSPEIDHVQQVKIYSLLFDVSLIKGININEVETEKVNQMVSALYGSFELLKLENPNTTPADLILTAAKLVTNL